MLGLMFKIFEKVLFMFTFEDYNFEKAALLF
jgi:hypothetical protein